MLTVSRRGLLVLGGTGAAGVALSACGATADQRDDASQTELLSAELDAETALASAYDQAASTSSGGQARALKAFAKAARGRADKLASQGAQAGGDAQPQPDGGPDGSEALLAASHLANVAIAAHRQAAGLLDTVEGRATASSFLAACAAELATMNGFAGRPLAPQAFVTGGPQPPYESTDEPATSTTTTTSTTSTSTASQ